MVSVTSLPLYTQERDLVPAVLEAGWATEPVGKSRPPLGFDPRTVQPVASGCTN